MIHLFARGGHDGCDACCHSRLCRALLCRGDDSYHLEVAGRCCMSTLTVSTGAHSLHLQPYLLLPWRWRIVGGRLVRTVSPLRRRRRCRILSRIISLVGRRILTSAAWSRHILVTIIVIAHCDADSRCMCYLSLLSVTTTTICGFMGVQKPENSARSDTMSKCMN